jgi:hypothetical protein
MANKIPVGATIARAYGFAFGNFFTNFGAIWIPQLILLGSTFLLLPHFMAMQAHMVHMTPPAPGHPPDLNAAKLVLQSNLRVLAAEGPYLLSWFAALFVSVTSMMAALSREALGLRKGSVLLAFPFGPTFLRLTAAYLLLAIIAIALYILTFIAGIVFGALIGLVAASVASSPFVVGIAVIVVIFAYIGAMIFVMTRLSYLVAPVAAAEKRISIGRSWTLTQGNFWRIVLIVLSVLLPLFAVEVAFIAWAFGTDFFRLPFGKTPAEIEAWSQHMRALNQALAERQQHYWYVSYPAFLVLGVVTYGLFAGLSAFAYRALVSEEGHRE